ncbi:hypothetical protein N9Z10_05290 [Akkermansiaceae bacterium]|mgnify:CR=1 FL=1|nr:hypothetical protein [Akkermansiaceae bacterium]MDB4392658.1 hypothetical protein [bacterium]MDA7900738.1 hypothetical protein [Akkermansiaceae bacterium]MDA7919546.1 hypothetical protein [Akkermansiaceae bacterium]MDA8974669.1 hypothetical protein [Akkermansiaceae bacterium]
MRRKEHTLTILRRTILLVILSGLITGCMTHMKQEWFGGQSTVKLKNGTKVGLWLNPTRRQGGVPLLLRCEGSEPPYGLQVFFPEPDPDWEYVTIGEVVIEYEDGTSDTQAKEIVWKRRRSGTFSGTLKNAVTRHASCRISVKGSISKSGGEKTGLSISHQFEAEPVKSMVAPTLWVRGQQG